MVARIEPEDLPLNRHVEFDASGSLIYVTDVAGLVFAYDTTTWEPIQQWDAHDSVIRGIALSPDGTTLVTTGEDDFVRTWDVTGIRETGATALQQIPAPKPSDAVWLSEDSLGIYLANGARWLRVNLEQPDLVAEAKARLTRGFTERECMVYAIDDCPMTLEDIKSGG